MSELSARSRLSFTTLTSHTTTFQRETRERERERVEIASIAAEERKTAAAAAAAAAATALPTAGGRQTQFVPETNKTIFLIL